MLSSKINQSQFNNSRYQPPKINWHNAHKNKAQVSSLQNYSENNNKVKNNIELSSSPKHFDISEARKKLPIQQPELETLLESYKDAEFVSFSDTSLNDNDMAYLAKHLKQIKMLNVSRTDVSIETLKMFAENS